MNRKLITILSLAGLLACGASAQTPDTNTEAIAESAVSTNPVSTTDYDSFRSVFSKRNMFDPTRRARRSGPSTPIKVTRTDSFTLVGTMSYAKSQLAFFDGSGSEYRKTLKPSETIAGYKIAQIAPNFVTLSAGSNRTINLPVGTRMRRQNGGHWTVSGGGEIEADVPPVTAAPAVSESAATASDVPAGAPPSAAEQDIVAKLMAKRLKEK